MADFGSIPPILSFPRVTAAPASRGPADLVAARIPAGLSQFDRVEISPAARTRPDFASPGSLSPFRTPTERNEAATGVARGRLVDRLA